MTPNASDPSQRALFIAMSDMADVFDEANMDLLGGVPVQLILAMVEAGDHLSEERRFGLTVAGALILRLDSNEQSDRASATSRMLDRLGLPAPCKDAST